MKDEDTEAFELALAALKEKLTDKPPAFIDILHPPKRGSVVAQHIESARGLAFGISEITMTDGKKIVCLEHISRLIHRLTGSLFTLEEMEKRNG